MTQTVLQAAFLFFFLVGLAAAAVGLILMLSPRGYRELARRVESEVSTRRALRPLETPIHVERWFYRHHRITGGLLLAAGLLYFLVVVFRQDAAAVLEVLPGTDLPWVALFWLLTLAHGCAAVLGLVILIRPSALKPLEAAANRWISTRRLGRPLEERHHAPDRWAMAHPRAAGMILILGGVFLMAAFGLFLAG